MFKVNPEHCIGCEVCVDVCPEEAIHINEEGVAEIDQEKCEECGACAEVCPQEAIEETED